MITIRQDENCQTVVVNGVDRNTYQLGVALKITAIKSARHPDAEIVPAVKVEHGKYYDLL